MNKIYDKKNVKKGCFCSLCISANHLFLDFYLIPYYCLFDVLIYLFDFNDFCTFKQMGYLLGIVTLTN